MQAPSLDAAPRKTYEFVVDNIIRSGVKRVFTLPGLGIAWSLPRFYERRKELDVFLTRSEQVASVMAQVTGKLTGRPGIFMGQVLEYLTGQELPETMRPQRQAFIDQIKEQTGYDNPLRLESAPGTLHHTDVVAAVQKFMGPDDVLTLDAGSNRIWHTNSLRVRRPNHLLVPGGIGGMGWGGPAAAAAKLAMPEKRVTGLSGDGGFMMTMDVVATCAQYGLDVVFLFSNNSGLGMVRDNMGPKRIAVDFGRIDFAKAAEGLGASGMRVDSRSGLDDALAQAHQQGGPVVIEVKVDPAASYSPAAHTQPLGG